MSTIDATSEPDQMSASVDPSTPAIADFYAHVNNSWLAANSSKQTGLDGPFRRARLLAEHRLDVIIAAEPPDGPLRTLHASYLALGGDAKSMLNADALATEFATCAQVGHGNRLGAALAKLQLADVHSPIELTISYSPDAAEWIPKVKVSEQWRAQSVRSLRSLASGCGLTEDELTRAQRFESALGLVVADAQRGNDICKSTLPQIFPASALATDFAGFPWNEWLIALGVPNNDQLVVVVEPAAVAAVAEFLCRQDCADLASWLRVRVVGARWTVLSDGTGADGARRLVERAFSEQLAHRYTAQFKPTLAVASAHRMAAQLRDSFLEMIATSSWCTAQGRQYAAARVADITIGIGTNGPAPPVLDVPLIGDDVPANLNTVYEHRWRRELARIGSGRERVLVSSDVYCANGLFDHSTNRLLIGLGLLEPPFFQVSWSDAHVFGALGVIVGHEIAHCLDLATWSSTTTDGTFVWPAADLDALRSRAARLVAQCASGVFEPLSIPHRHLLPTDVLNETICDSIGLAIAEHAFRCFSMSPAGRASAGHGRTAMQEFFIAWAWTMRATESTDTASGHSHSPARERCNWALRNSSSFHEAFHVGPKDPMWLEPDRRVTWWV